MAQLLFQVDGQIISRTDKFRPASKSKKYLRAKFTFSDDWGDGTKTAQFVNTRDGHTYDEILNEYGECDVPWEVLQYDHSKVLVSAFSGDRITTNEAVVMLEKSGYRENGSHSKVTPDVYAQIIDRMDDIERNGKRVASLDEIGFARSEIVEAVGNPQYIDDVTEYDVYGITETGWYVFARIAAKTGIKVTEETTVTGAAGYIAAVGADHIDVAVKFEVAAVSQPVTITWGEANTETFVFKATDLAIRNLDYRVTFYVYEADEFATWTYALTSDTVFAENKYYYTKDEDDNYTLADVTVGDPVPEDTYYNHSGVTFEGLTRNITYRCNTVIDCPVTFILPEIEDEAHGAWFELRLRHAGEYSITLVPPSADVKVATEHTQAEKEGVNMVNLHYSSVGGVKVWRFMNTHSTIPA